MSMTHPWFFPKARKNWGGSRHISTASIQTSDFQWNRRGYHTAISRCPG
jgi:hypothetical protein